MRPAYAPPALQAVTRDFVFTVAADLSADTLVRAIKGADKQAITSARLFDLFERDDVRSMAVEVTLQPGDKSRSEEHTSELQSLMRISYAVFCLKKKIEQIYRRNGYPTQPLNIKLMTKSTIV